MKVILPFDDFVLGRSENTRRVFKKPQWRFDCVYADEACNPRGIWPGMVVQAPDGGYMMMYLGAPGTEGPTDDEHLCSFMAYSRDGLHFEPCTVNAGAKYPHMRGRISDELGSIPYLDKDEPNPAYRYKSPCAPYGYRGAVYNGFDFSAFRRAVEAFVNAPPGDARKPVASSN